jgi:hypothetical protein
MEEVTSMKDEELSADYAEAKREIAQRIGQRPSAVLLSSVRGLCAGLVYAAPRVPRTLRLLRELHACATRWASLGWEPAILFCVYLTQTQAIIAKELGETSKALSLFKNTLQMIAEYENEVNF